jgi:catechol 2,3-dioxygenase-like lactoylglutathione lyase family enzyme
MTHNDHVKWNSLIPELSVSDFERSMRFYTKIVGFQVVYTRPESLFCFAFTARFSDND